MSYFEYKVVPAPSQKRWKQKKVDGLDKYASTVADLMTEMGLVGWDFIGAEQLKERRRKFFVLITDVERTLMIFRRPAQIDDRLQTEETRQADAAHVEPVQPRRVTRPELVEQVAAGARRVQVNVVRRPDEDATSDVPEDAPRAEVVAETAAAAASEQDAVPDAPGDKAHMLERAVHNTKAAQVAAE